MRLLRILRPPLPLLSSFSAPPCSVLECKFVVMHCLPINLLCYIVLLSLTSLSLCCVYSFSFLTFSIKDSFSVYLIPGPSRHNIDACWVHRVTAGFTQCRRCRGGVLVSLKLVYGFIVCYHLYLGLGQRLLLYHQVQLHIYRRKLRLYRY